AESGLCKVPLTWMIARAKASGLKFRTQSLNKIVLGKGKDNAHVAPKALAPSHDTMSWAWSVLEFVPRRNPRDSSRPSVLGWSLPLFERRSIPAGAAIHRSVIERREALNQWPANVPDEHDIER